MKIVTESISCLTTEDCSKYGVTLLPLYNVCRGEMAKDFIGNYDNEDSFTLPPSEYDYYRAFYDIVQTGEKVLCITLSRKLSQAYANAVESATKFESGDVVVMDSMTVAGGQFLMIMKAREMEASGMEFNNIVKMLEQYRHSITVSFAVTNISKIKKSKRISTFSRGNLPILSQKPVFFIMNGGVNYALGNNTIFGCIKQIIAKLGNPSTIIVHYSSQIGERDFVESVKKKFPSTNVIMRKVTASLLINIGDVIGAVGDGAEVK